MKYLVACAEGGGFYKTYEEAETAAKKHAVHYRQNTYVMKTVAEAIQPVPEVEVRKIEETPAA